MKPPSEKSAGRRKSRPSFEPLKPHEIELADFFVRMAGILGVPRSVAEIYALLYVTSGPLDFDHIQGRLGMSKGSVSQGLKFLRDHEMILSVKEKGARRERWQQQAVEACKQSGHPWRAEIAAPMRFREWIERLPPAVVGELRLTGSLEFDAEAVAHLDFTKASKVTCCLLYTSPSPRDS